MQRRAFDVLNQVLVWVGLVAGLAWAFGLAANPTGMLRLVPLLPVVLSAGAGVLLYVSAGSAPEEDRQAFRWVGLAALAGGAGAAIRASGDGLLASGEAVAAVGAATGLLFYPMAARGLTLFPHVPQAGRAAQRLALDTVAGAAAVAAVGWEMVRSAGAVPPTAAAWLERYAYPALGLALLTVLLAVLLRRSPYLDDRRLVLVGVGVGAVALIDVLAPAARVLGAEAVSAVNALWLVGYAALAAAAFWVRRRPVRREVPEGGSPRWKVGLPYGIVALLVLVLLIRMFSATPGSLAVLAAAGVVVGVVAGLRQWVGTREAQESLTRERDRILVAVSRELRDPLAAVSGFGELLDDAWSSLSDSERREMLKVIRTEARRMGTAVDDLVALVGDRLQRSALRIDRVDGKQLIGAAIKRVWDLREDPPNIKVYVEPFAQLVGDQDRLLQVVVHLLGNARRYGGGRVEVVVRRVKDARVIEVHDDGRGVPSRYESVIWDRFERGANRLNEDIPGSGLGLPLVRLLVEAHGGSVGYRRSERLGGACFWVLLPYALAGDAEPEELRSGVLT